MQLKMKKFRMQSEIEEELENSGGYQAGHANKFTISLRQSSTFDIFLLLN